MTCIIGYKENGKVYIGGDSIATNGSMKHSISNPKVFRREPFVFGYTTSFRMGQLLEFNLNVPEHKKESNYEYMVTKFVPSLLECFEKGRWLVEQNKEAVGGTFLVGYNGDLFEIQNNFSVIQSVKPFMSCGCGCYYANGAMEILQDLDISPEEKIERALQAVVNNDPNVSGPFEILEV